MRDLDVRFAVRRMLDERHRGDDKTRLVEEMGIWSGTVRVDVAVINGELQGFELKSHRDTLKRLPDQARLYSEVFDRVTLVVAESHADAAREHIPEWWGIVVAYPQGLGHVGLQEIRPCQLNPGINPLQLARLLWRAEALDALKKHGADRGVRSRSAEVIADRLARTLSLDELRREVRNALKRREGWLGKPASD